MQNPTKPTPPKLTVRTRVRAGVKYEEISFGARG